MPGLAVETLFAQLLYQGVSEHHHLFFRVMALGQLETLPPTILRQISLDTLLPVPRFLKLQTSLAKLLRLDQVVSKGPVELLEDLRLPLEGSDAQVVEMVGSHDLEGLLVVAFLG